MSRFFYKMKCFVTVKFIKQKILITVIDCLCIMQLKAKDLSDLCSAIYISYRFLPWQKLREGTYGKSFYPILARS